MKNVGEIDDQNAAAALQIAEAGAAGCRGADTTRPHESRKADESVGKAIDEVAQEIDPGPVVCSQRGRGVIGSALLGSVSRALATRTKRPVLIVPQHPS